MTRHIEVNASIEGKELHLRCRKFDLKKPTICPIHDCILHNFKMKLNAEAKVIVPYDPLNYKFDSQSCLECNDNIIGQFILGYSINTVPDRTVRQHSRRHRAQYTKTTNDSFAKIVYAIQ